MNQHDFTEQQLQMLNRFKSLKVGALFSQMGTGKTRVAVELVNYNKPDFLLYICPFSCKANVDAEIKKWGVECPYRIVGYETLSASDRVYMELMAEMKQHEKNFIIADESIFIKKGTTKRFKRSCELRRLCEWALVLNGTPIVNNERDIYNQMEFLSHKIFNMSYYDFLRAFFIESVFRTGRYKGQEVHLWTFYDENRPAFSKIIEPYVYMADLIFEHDEEEDTTYIEVSGLYEDTKKACLQEYSEFNSNSIVSMFTRLSTVAADDFHKNCEVAKYVNGRKCIVYCSRKREMKTIAKRCNGLVIDGDTKEIDRNRIIKEFTESDDKPLILSYGVGSFSLNLQTATEIVYSSLTFNFGQYEQSKFRIKRMGQEKDIKYTYLLADTGISRMMEKNLSHKAWLDEEIKRHIKEGNTKEWLQEVL